MNKRSRFNAILRASCRPLFVGCAALWLSFPALAACTATSTTACIADQPIQSATIVKPNVMFILDNSGSMVWDIMSQDSATSGAVNSRRNCRANFRYNTVYYNPNIDYTAAIPKDAANTSMGSQSFTNAKKNPFATSFTYANLSLSTSAGFCAEGETATCSTTSSYQTTKYQPAFYYKYTGAGSPGTACSADANYTKVVVGATSCVVGGDVTACPISESCTLSGGVTVCDERVNFANWYSYFRTRVLMMKSGMSTAFSTIDDKIRVGFHTINNPSSNSSSGRSLNIADFAATQKSNWYTALWSIAPTGGTPLQDALARVGNYYANSGTKTGLSGDPLQYSCQKNFTILSTDGYWNSVSTSVGDQDKTVPATMPVAEGKAAYDPADTGLTAGAQFPRPYYEGSAASNNSLADVAMYYWSKDLRTTGSVSANNVPTTVSDPAYWQHMNTFTVGLGVDGNLTFPDDLAALTSGTKSWPKPVADTTTAVDDLWHAAVNGRGQYYRATDPTSLSNSLNAALRAVTNTPTYVSPSSSTRDFKSPNQSDFTTYLPSYRLINWSGDVSKYTVDPATGLKTGTALWSAAYRLDSKVNPGLTSAVSATAYATRNIVTRTETGATVAFTYPTLSSAQQAALCYKVSPGTGACVAGDTSLVDYLRGDAKWEGDYGIATGAGMSRYRNRHDTTETNYYKRSLIGTIVNAVPVYVAIDPHNYQNAGFQTLKGTSRAPTVYAPANDGMVHAFDAATGNELWAYVPSFVIPAGTDENGKEKGLRALSYQDSGAPAYSHHFYVDATPEVGAVCADFPCAGTWKNILVGGLGKGGKGYYALDVTAPATTLDAAKSAVRWEFPDASNANKMGFSFGRPLVANTARWGWVVILPSGYNTADGLGHIFVLGAYSGALLKTMDTTAANLVNISALGNVNDGMVSEVYGSDLNGSIWRFDFGSLAVQQLFSSSASTPITSEMTIAIDGNTDTRWVFFGTGQYLDVPDRATTGQQYLVALKDGTSAAPRTTGAAVTLASLTATSPGSGLTSCPASGWKYALPTSGERVVAKPDAQLRTVAFTSLIPSTDPCSPGTSSYIYGMDYCTGASRLKINGSTVASVYSATGAGGVSFQGTGNSPTSGGKPQLMIYTPDGKAIRVELDTSKIYNGTRHVGWRELLDSY